MIQPLSKRDILQQDPKLEKCFTKLQELIEVINERGIPVEVELEIDGHLQALDEFDGSAKDWKKKLSASYRKTLHLLEKRLKLVRKNHYRDLWMPLGLAIFGLPIGMGIAIAIGNIGLLGAFMPAGMAVGMALGIGLDRQAEEQGRQLAV